MDRIDDFRGGLEVGVVFFENQRDAPIVDEGGEDILLHLAAPFDEADVGGFRILQVNGAFAETVDASVLSVGALQRREGETTAGEALAVDAHHVAIDLIAAAGAGGGDRCGDHHHCDVLYLLQILQAAAPPQWNLRDGGAHDFHRPRERPHRGWIVRFASAVKADDQADAAERVGFLAFYANNVAENRAAVAVGDAVEDGDQSEQRQDGTVKSHEIRSFCDEREPVGVASVKGSGAFLTLFRKPCSDRRTLRTNLVRNRREPCQPLSS